MSDYKLCSDCKRILPATTEFFPPFKRNTTTGLYTYCRECSRKRLLEYRNRNRSAIHDRENDRHSRDRDKYRKRNNEYRANNLEKERARGRTKYVSHPRIKRTDQELREQKRRYNKAHNKECNDQRRAWLANHPGKNVQYMNNRRARKLSLPEKFTDNDWLNCLRYWNFECAYCGRREGLFRHMKIEADHYIPITDPCCPGTVVDNILPVCKSCNASKNNHSPLDWLVTKFGKTKARQIIKRIETYFAQIEN